MHVSVHTCFKAAQASRPIREELNGGSYYGSLVCPTHSTTEPSARPPLPLILVLVWLWVWTSCYLQSINEPLQVCVVLLSELLLCEPRICSSMKQRLLLYYRLFSLVYIKPQIGAPSSPQFFSSLFRLLCLCNCLFCSVQAKYK